MSTHGPQHDEFGTRTSDAHGGATFDEGFNSFAAAHSNAHGKLFDKFSERPGVDRYGERWDEFPWKDMPSLHGEHYDEGYDAPSFDGGEHGQLHDVFRGARVRYMYGGRDVEGIVLDTQKEFAVVESREGDRHEVPLPQVLAYAADSGAPSRPEGRTAEPATVDTSVVSQKPSAPANGGERQEGGSYDDSVVTHVKSLDDALEVVKSLVPLDDGLFAVGITVEKSSDWRTQTAGKNRHTVHIYHNPQGYGKDPTHFEHGPFCRSCAHSLAREVMSGAHVTQDVRSTGKRCVSCHRPFADSVGKTFTESDYEVVAYVLTDVAKSSDGNPGVAHMTTAKLTEAHSKFSDHYTAARVTGNHERAHFAATVLASVHHELAARGVMADAPDEGATPVTRGLSKGHQPLRNKSAADDTDVTKDVDADETATQSQDLASEGANWCKTCQHYCRDARGGKCPTCGHSVGVKKSWMDELDVLKAEPIFGDTNDPHSLGAGAKAAGAHAQAAAKGVSDSIARYHGYNRVQPCKNCGTERNHNNVRQEGGKAFGTCLACHTRNPMTRKA